MPTARSACGDLGQAGDGVGRQDGRVLVGRVGDVEHRVELEVGAARRSRTLVRSAGGRGRRVLARTPT